MSRTARCALKIFQRLTSHAADPIGNVYSYVVSLPRCVCRHVYCGLSSNASDGVAKVGGDLGTILVLFCIPKKSQVDSNRFWAVSAIVFIFECHPGAPHMNFSISMFQLDFLTAAIMQFQDGTAAAMKFQHGTAAIVKLLLFCKQNKRSAFSF